MEIKNPLPDEAVVFDIIEEYKSVLKKLDEVNAVINKYDENHKESEKFVNFYRENANPSNKVSTEIKDNEELDF